MTSFRCYYCEKNAIFKQEKDNQIIMVCSEECQKEQEYILWIKKNIDLSSHNYDSKEIGRAGWVLLFAIADNYPQTPEEYHKNAIKQFVYWMSETYPCNKCRPHFIEMSEKYPLDGSCKASVKQSLCEWKNMVNERIGKSKFDCQCK